MEYKIMLSVFRFNAKTDYLPYYKKITLKIDGEKLISDMLETIKDDEKAFEYPIGKNAGIKINGLALFTNEKVATVVASLGRELTCEPLSTKRAIKDLCINSQDFIDKFDILDAFIESSDKKIYDSFINEYYASDILKYNDQYMGDALFAFAYEMIEKYPQRKEQILQAIACEENGIWHHIDISNKLFNKDLSLQTKIEKLKNLIIQEIPLCNTYVEKLSQSHATH
ncbi:MAG: DUF5644 domain-containing protein [Sulfurospirillum sp.]|nr:DUF5644 domain-containing protein [Sulfurospirillum sp.]